MVAIAAWSPKFSTLISFHENCEETSSGRPNCRLKMLLKESGIYLNKKSSYHFLSKEACMREEKGKLAAGNSSVSRVSSLVSSNGGADGVVSRPMKKPKKTPLNSKIYCHLCVPASSL